MSPSHFFVRHIRSFTNRLAFQFDFVRYLHSERKFVTLSTALTYHLQFLFYWIFVCLFAKPYRDTYVHL